VKNRCPQCGNVYPANFTYCNKDGAQLIRGTRRWPYLLGAAVGVLALAGVIAGAAAPAYVKAHLKVEVNFVDLHVLTEQPSSDLVFHFVNTSRIPINLTSISSACSVSGANIATIKWPPTNAAALAIPGYGSADLRASARLDLHPGNYLQALIGTGRVDCHGSMGVSVFGVGTTRDLSYISR
jgi:hypothetical protein